ncbi:MAG: YkgJ family cysteine cluster protein [Agathobacter sp.]|nr:YkgJ family cysteine cluster protein [Agathobacter sp.]
MDKELRKITDGRFYELNDMVKVGCHDCQGCSACCQGMGQSILLDPYDAYMLTTNLGKSFEELMEGPIELHVEEGLILPNLRMAGQGGMDKCSFLNSEGRCSIHSIRPGICRLFPLGRNYEGDRMNYFLLTRECPVTNKTKMKVSKWIDAENVKQYQQFLIDWHRLTKDFRQEIQACDNEKQKKQLTMIFLQLFYIKPYSKDSFYEEFYSRLHSIAG